MTSSPQPALVSFRSPRGSISYQDTRDHFENGLLRLLQLDLTAFQEWLRIADDEAGPTVLEALGAAFQRLHPVRRPPAPATGEGTEVVEAGPAGAAGVLWHPAIAESPDWGVARAADHSIAWLIRPNGAGWARERQPPKYEEAYFEGDLTQAGGYGDYGAQQGWRLEKARRQVRELGAIAPVVLNATRPALDIGSGYGFFRQALQEAGFAHQGLEISAHARAVARRLYGFETEAAALADKRDVWRDRFGLITLWDMIEHVAEPRALLADVAACLAPGGVVGLKTPNIDCPEAEMFGPAYHSLKREHLVYFGPAGLVAAGRSVGLDPVHVGSLSHLLTGFVGPEQTARWAAAGRGADLFVVMRKPGADGDDVPWGVAPAG